MRLIFYIIFIFGIFSNLIPPPVLADPGATLIAGAIATGASLIGTSISLLSESGPNRKVVIEISNHMSHQMYGGHYFLQWGWNAEPAPTTIKGTTREALVFEKVGHTATGTAGVLVYNIGTKNDPVRIAIVFSVPYNYIHASNWFGLKFIGTDRVNKELYLKMYSSAAWEKPQINEKYAYAYEGIPIAVYNKDYIVSATMSNLGRSILKVDVMKLAGGHEENEHLFRGHKK